MQGMSLLHIQHVSSFFFRYSDLFFDVETGPAPAFVFTLSLTFDYKDRVYFPVMACVPRWQMTAKEYAVMQNYTKGNDMGIKSCNVILKGFSCEAFHFGQSGTMPSFKT